MQYPISCILYARNNQNTVASVIKNLIHVFESISDADHPEYEIIVVDNGSDDGTIEQVNLLKKEGAFISLVCFDQQHHKSFSYMTGLSIARYPLIFITTADGRYQYQQLSVFINNISDFDVVTGCRNNRQDPWLQKKISEGWNSLVRFFFGLKLSDIDCDFKLFLKTALDSCHVPLIKGKKMIFYTELFVRLVRNKKKILELPVVHYPGVAESKPGFLVFEIMIAFYRLLSLRMRLIMESIVGYFGFVTGSFSRPEKPMETFMYRRSKSLLDADERMSISNCRVCSASKENLFFYSPKTVIQSDSDYLYQLLYCKQCRNAFVVPVPSPEQSILKTRPVQELRTLHGFFMRWFTVKRTERIFKLLKDKKDLSVLDIGGGYCNFANSIARSGCKVVVVEPAENCETYADKKSGVVFIPLSFSSLLLQDGTLKENSFDCITFWHSLEHFQNVSDVLNTAYMLLKPGGLLYINTPNISSLQAELGKDFWAYFDIPYQQYAFTPEGLIYLLRKDGFIPIQQFYFSVEYDVFGFYQTILNLLSQSHNVYYLNRMIPERINFNTLKYPLWTKIVTWTGIVWFPVALALTVLGSILGKQACIEMVCITDKERSNPCLE